MNLRESLAQAQERQSRLETEKDEAEMKISELTQDIQMRNNEVQREMRKKVSLRHQQQKTKRIEDVGEFISSTADYKRK